MDRFAQAIALALLLAAAACAGCSGGATGILTGSSAAADDPGSLTKENPMARPMAVAWTSARAQRCGFHFDAGKLRASYLAYEATQSAGEQYAKAERNYDATFKVIRERVSSDPDYCSDRKSAEIKTDLQRYLAGDFTPKLPTAKVAETCWFFCGDGSSARPWTADGFWAEQNAKNSGR